ncbi:MAG: hypothetical protein AAF066_19775 [Pseudomonadota bacterium]
MLAALLLAEVVVIATRVQALFEQGSPDFDFARLKLQADQIVDPAWTSRLSLQKLMLWWLFMNAPQ